MFPGGTQAEEYSVVVTVGFPLRICQFSIGMLRRLRVTKEQICKVIGNRNHGVSAFALISYYLKVVMIRPRRFHSIAQMLNWTNLFADAGHRVTKIGGVAVRS